MIKVVYNAGFGGYQLSSTAIDLYEKYSNLEYSEDVDRHDKILVMVVEKLGELSEVSYSTLRIKEIPKGSEYVITDYDGYEAVRTKDSYNWKTAQ